MKLLGYKIKDFTLPTILGMTVCSNMHKEIEMWLKDQKRYKLEDCSNDRDTKHVLKLFRELQERSNATSIQMIEYFYSLEKRIEELELSLEDTKNHMEWLD